MIVLIYHQCDSILMLPHLSNENVESSEIFTTTLNCCKARFGAKPPIGRNGGRVMNGQSIVLV